MLDLHKIASDFVLKHGVERAAEVTGRHLDTVKGWSEKKMPSVTDLQALLEADPDPIHAVRPLYEPATTGGRLAIAMITNRAIQPATMESIMKEFNSAKMQFIRVTTNNLYHGRNIAATRFLATGCEWLFFVDDDMILPCGDAAWFKQATGNPSMPDTFAGLSTIGRLLHHKKTLIGGCYFARKSPGVAQFNEAATSAEIDAGLRQGPRMEVRPTKWVATGSLLVHRSVLVSMIDKGVAKAVSPANARYFGYSHHFFDPVEDGMGEDVSFCLRAEKAGHQPFVDLSVMPAHIGNTAFNYHNTAKKAVI